jgi:hypothetical protein
MASDVKVGDRVRVTGEWVGTVSRVKASKFLLESEDGEWETPVPTDAESLKHIKIEVTRRVFPVNSVAVDEAGYPLIRRHTGHWQGPVALAAKLTIGLTDDEVREAGYKIVHEPRS